MKTEAMIGQAILGTDEDKARIMRQLTCRTAAAHCVTCECGNIHDEKKIAVVEVIDENGKERTLSACCIPCIRKNAAKIKEIEDRAAADYALHGQTPDKVRIATWDRFYTAEQLIQESKRPAVRAMSIDDVVRSSSDYSRPYAVALVNEYGILTNGAILVLVDRKTKIVADNVDAERLSMKEEQAIGLLTNFKSAEQLYIGETKQNGEKHVVSMVDRDGLERAELDAVYVKTAQHLATVKTWWLPEGDNLRVIGRNAKNGPVACIAQLRRDT